MRRAIGLSLALIVLSNSITLLIYLTGVDRQAVYFVWAVVVLAAVSWWARRYAKLGGEELGLHGKQWKRSAVSGMVIGCLLVIPSLAFLAFPVLLAEPARYREIQDLSRIGLLWRLGVELTIATALTEEILFRGILQALFKRALKATGALVATSIIFALWHLASNALTLSQNAVVLPFIPSGWAQVFGYLGSLVAVGIGGFILSTLRERTNHLAASIVAHWVSVAAITVLVYAT
ncbi:MAG: CPBP family intramembrane metalloprotease [Chloroflexota bacterium]|nr:CPBP family intramembrane metalloprotease [Chloroflexota bacterium]